MRQNQRGFAPILVAIAVVAILGVGIAAGYAVTKYNAGKTAPPVAKTENPNQGNADVANKDNASTKIPPEDDKKLPASQEAVCGNGICEKGEDPANCHADCSANKDCIEEGQIGNRYDDPYGRTGCCTGLVETNFQNSTGSTPVGQIKCVKPRVCGNGKCETGETAVGCSADCAVKAQTCDAKCKSKGYVAGQCQLSDFGVGVGAASDCRDCRCLKPNTCGNGICENGENATDCWMDCKVEGKEKCLASGGDWGYTEINCSTHNTKADRLNWLRPATWSPGAMACDILMFGAGCVCPASAFWGSKEEGCINNSLSKCGNGKCDNNETVTICPQDCGPNAICAKEGQTVSFRDKNLPGCCTGLQLNWDTSGNYNCSVCGNNKCDNGETVTNCRTDCGKSIVCGNGKCENGETSANCPGDCPCVTKGHYLPSYTEDEKGHTAMLESGNYQCCDGLGAISTRPTPVDGVCSLPNGTTGGELCTNCGDGICANGENYCNCRRDCPLPKCFKEGEVFSMAAFGNAEMSQFCCSGLNAITQMDCATGITGYICTSGNCGDGICGKYENRCNCPQDCSN